MYTNIDSNNSNSSPARHLGKLDSQTGRQKSFEGGNDERECRTLCYSMLTITVLLSVLISLALCCFRKYISVYAKVFWITQDIRSDVINEHTGPNLILSDRKILRRKRK
jgi:hypothetical protein